MNKHQKKCGGRFDAWASKSPGSINPSMGARLAAKAQQDLTKELVKALVAIQVSFSIFESPCLRKILNEIAPSPFDSSNCYSALLRGYFAIVLQWIDPLSFRFRKTLVSFESMTGSHTGVALAWTLWEALAKQGMIKSLYSITGDNAANNVAMITILQQKFAGIGIRWPKEERFHRCACHVINLVAKKILAHMGQLTAEDYQFFDDYLGVRQAPIEDSDEDAEGSNCDHQVISKIHRTAGKKPIKQRNRPLNHPTLETQDKSAEVELLVEQHFDLSDPEDLPNTHSETQTQSKTIGPQSSPYYYSNDEVELFPPANTACASVEAVTSALYENSKYQLTEEQWSSMEFMEPILEMFEQSCNIFQSKGPTKHLILPYYQVLLNRLAHYASVSPQSWCQACEAAWEKLHKYYKLELANNDTLIACLVNPKYREGIFKQLRVPISRSKEIIEVLNVEVALIIAKSNCVEPSDLNKTAPQDSSNDSIGDLLHHLNQPAIETSYAMPNSQGDEL
ncbi:hypothetical protein O181_088483, partial [Austropuccinia psidii MF-1]|nr:hypothetical protein [Austropuccinia psidii MF-1]